MLETNYAVDVEEVAEAAEAAPMAEKALIGFIVLAASLCVALIAAYVVLFDGRM